MSLMNCVPWGRQLQVRCQIHLYALITQVCLASIITYTSYPYLSTTASHLGTLGLFARENDRLLTLRLPYCNGSPLVYNEFQKIVLINAGP